MFYLFGSRSPACTSRPTSTSDADVFFTDDADLALFTEADYICNGGPLDLFNMPGADDIALPYPPDETDRRLLCADKWGWTVDPVPISPTALRRLLDELHPH